MKRSQKKTKTKLEGGTPSYVNKPFLTCDTNLKRGRKMKDTSFRALWLGQLFANFGDVLYIVGLISILYTKTGSAFSLALLPFLTTFGRFISGMVAPIILNRFPLKSILVKSQLIKTVLLSVLVITYLLSSEVQLGLILLTIFLIAFFDGWALPATNAMLPRLVKKNELVKANSFVAIITETTQLGGWALGGGFVALFSAEKAIWLTLGLFAVSTWVMEFIKDATEEKPSRKEPTRTELKEGWLLIWKHPLFRSIHVMVFLESIANVVWVAAILYVFVAEVLHVSEAWWGYMNTAFFLGLILGGVLCTKYSQLIDDKAKKTLLVSTIIIAIVTLLFGLNKLPLLAIILVTLSGFVEQIKGIVLNTYLQKTATTTELPKLYSAQAALSSLFFGLASILFGALADLYNVQLVFFLAAGLLAISAIYLIIFKQHFTKSI
jgi:MFS family permease